MKGGIEGQTAVFTNANALEYAVMPQNCCVPGCKKKVYVENGIKIYFHTLPEESKCPQLVLTGTRTTRHVNKGYVCMYVSFHIKISFHSNAN